MGGIKVIAASAGTGKTHRLATFLVDEVVAGRVRPDAIVATTFTNKAAAELEERVRGSLLRAGRIDAARLLRASRIGTVHAVCTRLIMDFAFELGLSPSLRVLDDVLASHALKEALSRVVDRSTLDELQGLATRMPRLRAREERGGQRWGGWQQAVDDLVGHARSNGITAEQLRSAAGPSWEGYVRLLDPPAASGQPFEERLREALGTFVEWVLANDQTRATRTVLDKARPIWERLRGGLPITWGDWGTLAALQEPAKPAAPLAEQVRVAARALTRHPALHRDARRAIELVHETAARALQAYEEHKRTWGVVDFRDQEVLALDLLRRDDVRARLGDELDLVLVDEFQDTSPIQLAIFLKLAELAQRSVWVGDQKQAIFGFRGTDPALVDAVLERLADQETETLSRSYRSRPQLVHLTSRLFEQAFQAHGIPAERVRLEPASGEEPVGLGPVLERWNLLAYRVKDNAAALAACVREMLLDATVRVRDRHTGAPRPVKPADVAVLCRTNYACADVAAALEGLGVRAVRARGGLFSSPEGIVGLAALQAFADPKDALAIAQLSRFLAQPDAADGWLEQVLSAPYAAAHADLPAIQALRQVRASLPTAGAVTALDAAVEAVGLAEPCLRWGDAEQRLANVDRLRGLAIEYANHCATTGAGCTPAGLAAHFQALAQQGMDAQAQPSTINAVQLSTWHAAKGLEWPIVVLYDLYKTAWDDVLGPHLVDRGANFELADPLQGRWVRFWPDPFDWQPRQRPRTRLAFFQRLDAEPSSQAAYAQSDRQLLRLLYVGWTRARDRLVLAAREQKLTDGILAYLTGPTGPLIDEPGQNATWVGMRLPVVERSSAGRERRSRPTRPGAGYHAAGPATHPPAVRLPSEMLQWGPVSRPISLGDPILVRGRPEMNRLGEAVHGFLAADRLDLPTADRLALAQGLLQRHAVAGALAPADLLEMSGRLHAWLAGRFPQAGLRREWPFQHRQADGVLLRGQADLVVDRGDEGLAVIDHKTLSGTPKRAIAEAAGYAGQLTAYAFALSVACGRPVRSCFFHLPLTGVVVELAPVQLELAM